MTKPGKASRLEWTVLRAMGLCGILAFLISIASPLDDAEQQECLAARTRHHTARLLTVRQHGIGARHINSLSPQSVARWQPGVPTTATSLVAHILPPQGAVLAHQTGDRSPPQAIL